MTGLADFTFRGTDLATLRSLAPGEIEEREMIVDSLRLATHAPRPHLGAEQERAQLFRVITLLRQVETRDTDVPHGIKETSRDPVRLFLQLPPRDDAHWYSHCRDAVPWSVIMGGSATLMDGMAMRWNGETKEVAVWLTTSANWLHWCAQEFRQSIPPSSNVGQATPGVSKPCAERST